MSARHLLVAGAQRCGTTWLHDALAAHPEIAMARPARPEPKVFLDQKLADRGREWYRRAYFAHARDERILGEKSTSYLEDPRSADRASVVLGDPLVLVLLRDPVQRALSHWAFSTDNGFETRPMDEVLAANVEGPLPWDPALSSVSPYAYLERGRYVDYLRPWADRFGPDLSVVFLEELTAEPAGIRGVYAWLGVDDGFRPKVSGPVNPSHTETPRLNPDLEERLEEYFREGDQALADLLGRDPPWA